ncbi:MAG: 16S rRNA (uracil(1498)-N(3))-methyltransferase [Granulosicoccaceae bacterium]|jgi:16S rRNA (uracil1498-N3)-methyltransferase
MSTLTISDGSGQIIIRQSAISNFMRISRLFIDAPLKTGQEVLLDKEQLNYVSRVLRLKPGMQVTVFNGQGGEYSGTITQLHKRSGAIEIAAFHDVDIESPLNITLVQGISRGERMDYTLQKATELGVTRIAPVFCGRTVVSLKGERLDSRLHHWRGVIRSACEQSGRNRLPQLLVPCSLEVWLANDDAEQRLLLHPGSDRSLRDNAQAVTTSLLIGPEGGLTEAEREHAMRSGYMVCRLGPRILRTETAALAALACLQLMRGDLNA